MLVLSVFIPPSSPPETFPDGASVIWVESFTVSVISLSGLLKRVLTKVTSFPISPP